ncbi:MAG: 3-methyl-2-oxobutanoate dehydrogenase subunit VorB [bacterium]
MSKKILLKGNDALCEGAVQSGCRAYYGYPITPQNEVPAYMSKRMIEVNGSFIQAESELASINMVLGAAVTGARAMTTSSSPGISLMQEGISYLAGCELPCLIANIMRGGPGLGNISGSQSDYFQSTRGGGHGDYRTICLAPSTVQELYDFPALGFHLAEKYRSPVIIVADGFLAQMMEGVDLDYSKNLRDKIAKEKLPEKNWVLNGCVGREPRFIRSLFMVDGALKDHNYKLQEKYGKINDSEQLWEEYNMADAKKAIVAFGVTGRIAKEAIKSLGDQKIGLIRPITLWPFPKKAFEKYLKQLESILVVELNSGQMVEDVLLSVSGKVSVDFLGKPGGEIITPDEITEKISKIKSTEKVKASSNG